MFEDDIEDIDDDCMNEILKSKTIVALYSNTVCKSIVLKRKNFGEADRILTVFTTHRGKISVLAKGVRRITSRRAGNVELLNRVSIFLHQTKGMPILTEAVSLDTYPKLKGNLKLSTVAFHIIELVDKLTAENQENRSLYTELVEVTYIKHLNA